MGLVTALACPMCALGGAHDGAGGVVLVAALLAIPVGVAVIGGMLMGRILRRPRGPE